MIESMLIAGFLGLPAAMLTAMLLKRRCLARYFYKVSLIFVPTCVLAFGPGKSVSAFVGHKGQTVHMDTDAKDKAKTTKDKVKAASLIEQAHIVIDINRRYYKFYGKPSETVVGGGSRTVPAYQQLEWGGAINSPRRAWKNKVSNFDL